MKVLPLTYLGNIEYFSLLSSGNCVIDTHENYVKQTYRNRCYILGANGAMPLTVTVEKPSSAKCAVRDVRIDYAKRWQHQQWQSVVSAYRNSPYFDHYEALFEPFYSHRYEFLLDYNVQLLELCVQLLGGGIELNFSDKYIEPQEVEVDFRATHTPKQPPAMYAQRPYYQVFSEKMDFVPNLSIFDLLCSEGLSAKSYL